MTASIHRLLHGRYITPIQKTIGIIRLLLIAAGITKLKPVRGFCAETGGAITLFAATGLGVLASKTHTITGTICGVGSVRPASAVRWGLADSIVMAWIVTIPATGLIAALFRALSSWLF